MCNGEWPVFGKEFSSEWSQKVGVKIILFIVPFMFFLSVHFSCDIKSGNYPLKHAAAANVAFCDEAKVASITLKHAATNVATPSREIQPNVAMNQ